MTSKYDISAGTENWDVPLNANLDDIDARLTSNTTNIATNTANIATNTASITSLQAGSKNVKDFGAKGDGVTDDTAAVQAAINAGGTTFFPSGVYLCGTLNIPLGARLEGVMRSNYAYPVPSSQSSTIKLANGTNASLLVGADGANNVNISNLSFDGNKANNTSGDVIHLNDASAQDTAWYVRDCYFDNSPHDGVYIGTGRQAVKFNRVWGMRSANNNFTVKGADAGFDTVLSGLAGANSFYLGAWVIHLSNCDIWSSGANGIVCDNTNFVSIVNCGIDRHMQSGIVVQTGGAVNIDNCLLHSNSQQTNNTYAHISITGGSASVTNTQFGTDSGITNTASWAISIGTGTAAREFGNVIFSGGTVQGYIDNPSRVLNAFGGPVTIPAGSQLNIGSSSDTATPLSIGTTATGNSVVSSRVTGDTAGRFVVNGDGKLSWGTGAATPDANLYRSAANTLKTDDKLIAALGLDSGSQKITNVANGTAATDGAAFGQIPTSLPPNGSAGGDLSGTYPNPTVAKVNGVTVSGTPTANQVPVASSGTAASWGAAPASPPNGSAGGDLSGTYPNPTVKSAAGAFAVTGALSGTTETLSATTMGSVLAVTNNQTVPNNAAVRVNNAASGDLSYATAVTGDSNNRMNVDSNGKFTWGPGNAATDTNLYRGAASTLQTDGNLKLFGGGSKTLSLGTAGGGLAITDGSNCRMGITNLNGTTPVVIANTTVTAVTRIFLTVQSPTGTPGVHYVSARTAGTSFTIVSTSSTDTSSIAWLLVEPA